MSLVGWVVVGVLMWGGVNLSGSSMHQILCPRLPQPISVLRLMLGKWLVSRSVLLKLCVYGATVT